MFLDRALERPGAVHRIVADPAEPGAGAIGQLDPDLAVVEQLLEPADLDVDDRPHVAGRQPVEQDDLVQPVEEFRPEV